MEKVPVKKEKEEEYKNRIHSFKPTVSHARVLNSCISKPSRQQREKKSHDRKIER